MARGRPRAIQNIFSPAKSNVHFSEGQKSKGILDDFAVRKIVNSQEGTIEKVPVDNSDIVNKLALDTAIAGVDLSTKVSIAGDTMTGTLSGANVVLTGDVQAVTGNIAGLDISNDGTKTTILGTAGDYNRIGDGSVASRDLYSNDDLLVTGRLEVDGNAYFEGPFEIYASDAGSTDAFTIKNTGGVVFYRYVPRIHDGMHIAIGSPSVSYYNFIYTTYDNRKKNHDHTQQVNPTIVIHSATNPDTNNTQWLSLTHDQTDGVITTGAGHLKVESLSGGILIPDAPSEPAAVANSGILYISGAALYFKGGSGTNTLIAAA